MAALAGLLTAVRAAWGSSQALTRGGGRDGAALCSCSLLAFSSRLSFGRQEDAPVVCTRRCV